MPWAIRPQALFSCCRALIFLLVPLGTQPMYSGLAPSGAHPSSFAPLRSPDILVLLKCLCTSALTALCCCMSSSCCAQLHYRIPGGTSFSRVFSRWYQCRSRIVRVINPVAYSAPAQHITISIACDCRSISPRFALPGVIH